MAGSHPRPERLPEDSAFTLEMARVNIERLALGFPVMLAIHAIHACVFFAAVDGDGTKSDDWDLAIAVAHAVMMPPTVLAMFVIKKVRAAPLRFRRVPAIVGLVYLTFTAVLVALDQLVGGSPIAFVIGALALATFIRLDLAETIACYTVGIVVLMVGVELVQTDPSLRRSVEANAIAVAALGAVIARSNMRLHRRMFSDRRTIERQAVTDALTGALTRGAFMEAMHRTLVQALGRSAALVLLDIDYLKRINDSSGHAAGDSAIIGLARAARVSSREADILGRLGGDELALLLPQTSETNAVAIAERIRVAAEQAGISVSLGVAEQVPGESADRWLARADEALYRAKNAGRNRVST